MNNDNNNNNDNREKKDGCNVEYAYKTCYLKASIKKLLMTSRKLKNMTIVDALRFSSLENKAYSALVYKSLKCIMSNMVNVRHVDNVDQYMLCKVIIEKKKRISGIRYKARGGYSITDTFLCRFNIYLRRKV